jgi:hypothetical protein
LTESFRSNIGRDVLQIRQILAADLIIIDMISMLTPWVANRAYMTLQPISAHDRIKFGGKSILFVGISNIYLCGCQFLDVCFPLPHPKFL